MRQSEFKKKYNPVTGKFTKQHIWNSGVVITGEGITDKFKSLVKRKKKHKKIHLQDLKIAPLIVKKLVIK